MAVGFIMMLASGIIMIYVPIEKSLQFKLYQWHKAVGVLLFLAFFVRIIWRLISHAMQHIPALPAHFSYLEQWMAKFGHLSLYGLMLMMPLSGWVMVSASVYGLPTIVFDWFEWPHIPGIQGNKTIEARAKEAHFYLSISFGLMITLHIAAVIRHWVKDKENLMIRMLWTTKKQVTVSTVGQCTE